MTETISYTDAVIELAEALNDLAPLVEKCLYNANTPNQAISHLHNLLEGFARCKRHADILHHVQGLMKSRQWHIAPVEG